MANVLFTNNAATRLATDLSNTGTSLTVINGTGALFPTISGSNYFYCTLIDTVNDNGAMEIVKVTGRNGDTFTIQRGQDNTTAIAFPADSAVELRVVAAALEDMMDQISNNARYRYVLPNGAENATLNLYANAATGNDNNDGLTANTAVKTWRGVRKLLRSLDIGMVRYITINLAAGDYSSSISNYSSLLVNGDLPRGKGLELNINGAGSDVTFIGQNAGTGYSMILHNLSDVLVYVRDICFTQGVTCRYYTKVYFTDCKFGNRSNTPADGGSVVYASDGSFVTLTNAIFYGNVSDGYSRKSNLIYATGFSGIHVAGTLELADGVFSTSYPCAAHARSYIQFSTTSISGVYNDANLPAQQNVWVYASTSSYFNPATGNENRLPQSTTGKLVYSRNGWESSLSASNTAKWIVGINNSGSITPNNVLLNVISVEKLGTGTYKIYTSSYSPTSHTPFVSGNFVGTTGTPGSNFAYYTSAYDTEPNGRVSWTIRIYNITGALVDPGNNIYVFGM